MIIVAHRGSNKKALENTFQAFDICIAEGATRIEFDVQLTKDSIPVVSHDNSLKKHLGVRQKISQINLNDLHKLFYDNQHELLTLEAVLKNYSDKVELNIEIKPASLKAGRVVHQYLLKCVKPEDLNGILVSSFQIKPLEYFSKNAPNINLACLWCRPRVFAVTYKDFMTKIGCRTFHPYARIVNKKMMDYCQENNFTVIPYCGINDEDKLRYKLWTKLKKLNIDGLCTNYPLELREWIENVAG